MNRRRHQALPRSPIRRRADRSELDRAASDPAWNARSAYEAWREELEQPPPSRPAPLDVDPSEIADIEAFEAFLELLGPAVPRRRRVDH